MKTVLITGASSGIGEATARLFQKERWNVAATMRHPETGKVPSSENVRAYRLDVTNRDSIESAISSAINDFGKIDVVVNNAGIYTTGPLELTPDEALTKLVETNVIGTINVIKGILPHFRQRRGGTIINVSSIAGKVTFPYQTIYHGTKWAIEGISEALQYELKTLNVVVKIVEPGMVKTNLYDNVKAISTDNYPQEYKTSFSNWHQYLVSNIKNGYDPTVDARTIFRAATDNRSRFRYVSDRTTRLVLLLKTLLPLPIFNAMIQNITKA